MFSYLKLDRIEEELSKLRKLENVRKPIPCPDGKDGCLVYHYELVEGPIEKAIRYELAM